VSCKAPQGSGFFLDRAQRRVQAIFGSASLLEQEAGLRERVTGVAAITQMSSLVDFPQGAAAGRTRERREHAEVAHGAHVTVQPGELDFVPDRRRPILRQRRVGRFASKPNQQRRDLVDQQSMVDAVVHQRVARHLRIKRLVRLLHHRRAATTLYGPKPGRAVVEAAT